MKALEVFKSAFVPQYILDKAVAPPMEAAKKIDHIATLMKLISTEAQKLKAEESLLAKQRKNLEALYDKAEACMKEEMSSEGICELQGELIKFNLSNSQPKLIIDDESLIPDEYKHQTVVTEIRKDAIKDELKLGAVIPGCRLEVGQTLKTLANN